MDNKEAERIFDTIEIDEQEALLFELRQRVLAADLDEAKQIIEELTSREKSHYLGHSLFDNQPYYYLYEAYAHNLCGESDVAIDRANRSASLFRMRNLRWNEALVHWFLYLLYGRQSRKEESCKELQTATAILEGLAKGYQREGRIADCQSCQAILRQLYRDILLAKPEEELVSLPGKKGYLLTPWTPVYEKVVQDEKETLVWAEPSQNIHPEIQLIIIGERWFTIKPVKSGLDKIQLEPAKEYGWARVCGDDMNAALPVALEDGDYVLFIKRGEVRGHGEEDENSFVIASRWKSRQEKEYAYMVRKLGKKVRDEDMLYSESTKTGDNYKPIPVGEDVQILGYVVAIAKPVRIPIPKPKPSSKGHSPKSAAQPTPSATEEEELYQSLLRMAHGDEELVKRLLTLDFEAEKGISRKEALERALLHWRRQTEG
jgi:hypothetical protein